MIFKHHHPGYFLRETVVNELDIPITALAKNLNISRVSLSKILNGKSGISAEFALKLEAAGFSTAKFWLSLQNNYELFKAKQKGILLVNKIWHVDLSSEVQTAKYAM